MWSPETRAVHAGRDQLGDAHVPPIDLSSTYRLGDLGEGVISLDRLAAGAARADNPVYARLHAPTVDRFERALASLEQAPEAVSFASGMAAITACLLAARERGDHVVAVRPLYGGTDHLLESGLLGLRVDWVAPDAVAGAIGRDTALVILETPANPTLDLVDIEAVVGQAGPVPVLVDSTFATPVLQRPRRHGATLVVHSATKYLGGHGDVVGGVVATDATWAASLRQVRIATGGLLHPLAAWLLHRGLQTLPARVRLAQAHARDLAARLLDHPAVERVRYPGLPGEDPQGLVGRQMDGPGAMIAFEVRGGLPVAARVLDRVGLITPAVSLGSVDTLIQHPAGLTHRLVPEEARQHSGVTEGLLRLSVGLEDPDDLWTDLSTALEAALAAHEDAHRANRPPAAVG